MKGGAWVSRYTYLHTCALFVLRRSDERVYRTLTDARRRRSHRLDGHSRALLRFRAGGPIMNCISDRCVSFFHSILPVIERAKCRWTIKKAAVMSVRCDSLIR